MPMCESVTGVVTEDAVETHDLVPVHPAGRGAPHMVPEAGVEPA